MENKLHLNGEDYRSSFVCSQLSVHESYNGSLSLDGLGSLLFGNVSISYDTTNLPPTELHFKRYKDDLINKDVEKITIDSDKVGTIPLNDIFFDSIEIDSNFSSSNISVYFSGYRLNSRHKSHSLQELTRVNNSVYSGLPQNLYKYSFETLQDAIDLVDKPDNYTKFEVKESANEGYYIFLDTEPNGVYYYSDKYESNVYKEPSTILTTLENNIRKSFLDVKIWGENVDLNDRYYLKRLGYDRVGYNDITFQIWGENSGFIAYDQFSKTDYDTGVQTYKVNDYQNGVNVEFTINWDYVPLGTGYEGGTLGKYEFDNDKIYISTQKPQYYFKGCNVYKHDNTLYIASKFSDTHDVLFTFDYTMFNELYTLKSSVLVTNTSSHIIEQFNKPVSVLLCDAVSSDIIGPHKITGGGWIGGNHGYEHTLTALTSNYVSGSNTLDVTDGSLFTTTGGTARTETTKKIFSYTNVVGNQLQGVTGLDEDLNIGDNIQLYVKTAETKSFSITLDNKEIPNRQLLNTDKVIIDVVNEIFDSGSFVINNAMSVSHEENVRYIVTGGNIQVSVTNVQKKDMNFDTYYGFQMTKEDFMQKVYIPNGQDTAVTAKGLDLFSGDHNLYDTQKLILSKSNDIYNIGMFYINEGSYYDNRNTFLSANDNLYKSLANSKTYRNQVTTDTLFQNGEIHDWSAVYTFFSGVNTEPYTYFYHLNIDGQDYISIDFHSAQTVIIPVPLKQYNKLEVTDASPNITVDTRLTSKGLKVTSTGYGSVLLKLS